MGFFLLASLATEKVFGLFVPQNPPFQYAKKSISIIQKITRKLKSQEYLRFLKFYFFL